MGADEHGYSYRSQGGSKVRGCGQGRVVVARWQHRRRLLPTARPPAAFGQRCGLGSRALLPPPCLHATVLLCLQAALLLCLQAALVLYLQAAVWLFTSCAPLPHRGSLAACPVMGSPPVLKPSHLPGHAFAPCTVPPAHAPFRVPVHAACVAQAGAQGVAGRL